MKELLWPEGAPHALGDEERDRPWLDLCPIMEGPPKPAIIVCPGGGYWVHADHEAGAIAEWITGLGLAAFVLRYRIAPYQHPAPLLDAQRAIRLVRARAGEWNVDPNGVGILGFSAGGHLAATAGTLFDKGDKNAADPVERESCRPSLMVVCYAVTSFADGRNHGCMARLIGEDAPDELRARLSPELQVTADTSPAFLWHTADDDVVPVENSLLMAGALAKHKVPFALHVFECGRHGLGLATDDPDVGQWTKLCASWLAGRGF